MSNQKRRLPFVQLDVFTAVPLEGNQLAVFPDARGLSDSEMQALAREMNLSESTFIIPRDQATERERGVRKRCARHVAVVRLHAREEPGSARQRAGQV